MSSVAPAVRSGTGDVARGFRVGAARSEHAQFARRWSDEDYDRGGVERLEERGRRFPGEQLGEDCRVHETANNRFVGIGRRDGVACPGSLRQDESRRGRLVEIALRAQRLEHRLCEIEVSLGGASRAGRLRIGADGMTSRAVTGRWLTIATAAVLALAGCLARSLANNSNDSALTPPPGATEYSA